MKRLSSLFDRRKGAPEDKIPVDPLQNPTNAVFRVAVVVTFNHFDIVGLSNGIIRGTVI